MLLSDTTLLFIGKQSVLNSDFKRAKSLMGLQIGFHRNLTLILRKGYWEFYP